MSSSPPAESPPSNSNSSDSPSPPPPSTSSPPSPPPPSDSNSSPPPPSDSSSSISSPPPPPPKENSSSPLPPPPPPNNSNSKSPPPPPEKNSPPSDDNNKKSPPSNDNNNRNSPPSGRHPPPPPPGRGVPGVSSRDHSPPALGSSSDDGAQKSIAAGAAAGAGLFLLMFIAILFCCCRRKKRKGVDQMNYYRDSSHGNDYYDSGPNGNWHNPIRTSSHHMIKMPPPPPPMCSSELSSANFSGPYQPPLPPPHPAVALGFNQSSFTYDDLAAATNNFSQSSLLGQGGFGFVHKGVLPNGKEIAVKSLKANSGQGEREFQAEVDIISRVHHRHLVSLVGYCIAGAQRMLVYEFVSNGTLEYHLHGAGRPTMDFPTRLKIAMGSAKGFAYLHEDCHPRIIHRDIKAANILLEDNFEAKVADFGLAKLSSDTNTHVSTRIMGTFGYLAPEYAQSGKLTEKSDVYSYGIMLLELITGRRPVDISRDDDDDDTLIDWARPILAQVAEGGSFQKLVDRRLENNYDPQEMLRMVASAGACIRHSARRRPKMSQIVRALEGDVSLDDLNDGAKPGAALFGSASSSDYDLKKFGKGGALSSQEFSSSEHGVNREYAQ